MTIPLLTVLRSTHELELNVVEHAEMILHHAKCIPTSWNADNSLYLFQKTTAMKVIENSL